MSSDYTRLLKQDFSDCEAAASAWRTLASRMDGFNDRHRQKVTGPLHAEWEGDDGRAALFYLEELETRFGIVRTEATTIAEVINLTKLRMAEAQKSLREAVKGAEAEGFTVQDDGKVVSPKDQGDPPADESTQELADRLSRSNLVDVYQREIDIALDTAREASDKGVKGLADLQGDILEGSISINGAAAKVRDDVEAAAKGADQDLWTPHPPQDPKEAAKWWADLPQTQKDSYAAMHPEIIGRTDGLPTTVRDDANRLALERDLAGLEFGPDAQEQGLSNDEYNKKLNNLQLLRDELDKRDGATGNRQLYVLGFDGGGDGKAILAMGNPDTADNVGVQVPGTATTMESTGGQLERISKLQRSAEAADSRSTTSMVYWLGYDAPEIPVTEAASLGVAGKGRAEDAAPDLRHFTHGLRASHDSDRPHNLTVLGHSYGTTVVGIAASGDGGLDADNILSVGSPGMGVDNAKDLNVAPGHFYTGIAEDDPIRNVTDLTLGTTPNKSDFGGTRFKVDTEGHSGYWDDNSESLRNQGRIIAGMPPSRRVDKPLVPVVPVAPGGPAFVQ